jgi:hypothetical protein
MTEKNTAQGAKPAAEAGLKARVSGRLNEIINRIKAFLNQIYLGEDTYNYVGKKLVNAVKCHLSTQIHTETAPPWLFPRLYDHHLAIPTLTVALTFYSVVSASATKGAVVRTITLFMLSKIRLNSIRCSTPSQDYR